MTTEKAKEAKAQTGDEQELVGNQPSERNWRGIGIALLVILSVCALIVTAVVLLTPDEEAGLIGERLNFDQLFTGEFSTSKFAAYWVTDSKFVYRDEDGALLQYDARTLETKQLMDNSTFRLLNTGTYYVSPDLSYVLLAFDRQQVWRHSRLARYAVHNIITEEPLTYIYLSEDEKDVKLQYCGWGPVGHSLVIVHENEIYYKGGIEANAVRVTYTGVPDVIYNGIPDWIYEEEVLSSSHALWWSPNGQHIVFATFNDSQVKTFSFPKYGDESPYSSIVNIRYPKAGEKNPVFTLTIFNVKQPSSQIVLKPPVEIQSLPEYYLGRVKWIDDSRISVIWINRHQNSSVFSTCIAQSGQCNKHFTYQEKKGWVEVRQNPIFDKKFNFFYVLPQLEGNYGDFMHVTQVKMNSGREFPLTRGTFDVTSIVGYNAQRQLVFYLATADHKERARWRHLYTVGAEGSMNAKRSTCLTCKLDENCNYYSAYVSSDGEYYILYCQGPRVPRWTLHSIEEPEKVLDLLYNFTELQKSVAKTAIPQKKFYRVNVSDNYEVNVQILLPVEYKKEEVIQYPLLIDVYGAPGGQKVRDTFRVDWHTYLASSLGIIVASIDGRGVCCQGNTMKHEIYRALGTKEVEDQIVATMKLKDLHKFIDPHRIAIWGWSYGGYVSAMALSHKLNKENKVFKCGASVAPVTSWRLYDSIYTERYMGLPAPTDNFAHYKTSTVMNNAENFKDIDLLLVHGEADDNVHYQNSALLMKTLQQKKIQFKSMIYPDQDHGIRDTSEHLYQLLTDHLLECFEETVEIQQHVQPKTKNKKMKKLEADDRERL